MRVTQRQPICITRLKKKPSSHNIPSISNITVCKESRIQLLQFSSNLVHEHSQPKQLFYRQSSKQSCITAQNLGYQKENILTNENLCQITHDEQLLKRIKQLELNNEYLNNRNHDLTTQLATEQNQKRRLNTRIEKLQKDLRKIESQFQQQYQGQAKQNPQTKPFPFQLRLSTPKQREYSSSNRNQSTGYRRLSFHENMQYKSQDLSSKVKQYKNQLQMEKIRRLNLERELHTCKQNIKLQFKNQLQAFQHKIDNMKEVINRKDKEIKEKEDLIQRYIVKKSS